MILFAFLNMALRAVLTLCTIYCILRFGPRMNIYERAGAGLVGGASLMTIPMIYDIYKQGTPFDGWATSVITLGCILIFLGLIKRARAHELRNAEARRQAAEHLAGKGKL